jgi:CheY-like chemotaxis protein
MAKPNVLIAEDNNDLRELYSFILAQAGCEVRQAADGREALRMLKQERPDVLVTDVMMPGMTGVELVERVRCDDELQTLPVVVMSAFADYLAKAYILGGTVALRKPADPDGLRRAVFQALPGEVEQ